MIVVSGDGVWHRRREAFNSFTFAQSVSGLGRKITQSR
jgi:hypothetical protein